MVLEPLRVEGHRPAAARLGPQAANAEVRKPPVVAGRLINDPLVWGAVIFVLVVLLAWALFRATRRISEMPSDPTA